MNLRRSLNGGECQHGLKKKSNKTFQFKYFKINLHIMRINYYAIPIQAITLDKNRKVVHSFS